MGLGAAWPQNVTGDTTIGGVVIDGDYSLNGGFATEVGAGYDFGPVRAELTYSYNHASLNSRPKATQKARTFADNSAGILNVLACSAKAGREAFVQFQLIQRHFSDVWVVINSLAGACWQRVHRVQVLTRYGTRTLIRAHFKHRLITATH